MPVPQGLIFAREINIISADQREQEVAKQKALFIELFNTMLERDRKMIKVIEMADQMIPRMVVAAEKLTVALEKTYEALAFAPGGMESVNAKEHFESLKKQ